MNWTFSWGWFWGGIALAIAGILIVRFYRQVAENIAHGLQSYEKVKAFGVGATILGFVFMANLHTIILYFIFHIIMPNQFP